MKTARKILITLCAVLTAVCFTGCVFSVNDYENADQYNAGDFDTNCKITVLDINWTSGNVNISYHDKETVAVTEHCDQQLDPSQKVQTWLEGTTLHVRYCKPGINFNLKNPKKDLDIRLPKELKLDTLDCGCTTAAVTLTDIAANSLNAEVTSGSLTLTGCSAKTLKMECTSGNITAEQKGSSDQITAQSTSGAIRITAETAKAVAIKSTSGDTEVRVQQCDTLSASGTSGGKTLHLASLPASAEIEATSGNVNLFVPKNADLTLSVNQTSGKFNSDLAFAIDGTSYTAGSGASKFSVETTSGNITVQEEP